MKREPSSATVCSGSSIACVVSPDAFQLTIFSGLHCSVVRLASTASTDDLYYVGSKIQITGGTGAGASSVITRYCGQTHASCQGLESTGTLAAVAFTQDLDADGGGLGPNTNIASTLLIKLPTVDGGGRSIAAGAADIATCASRKVSPYMTDYRDVADCTGSMKGFNIYITGGTGAGSVGLIRAGPDAYVPHFPCLILPVHLTLK